MYDPFVQINFGLSNVCLIWTLSQLLTIQATNFLKSQSA